MTRIVFSVLWVLACSGLVVMQGRAGGQESTTRQGTPGDWALANADIGNSGYSPLDEITPANAGSLTARWTFDLPKGDSVASETPIVANGVMYFNSGSRLFALDAATGQQRWVSEVAPAFKGGGRGPAYGDGRVYAFGPTSLYAVDAKTGKAVDTFGEHGVLRIINRALELKEPGKYPSDLDPTSLGYSMTTAPMYHEGLLYVGIPFSDSLIEGGLLVAADGKTGAIKWVFRTVPQGPKDDGWELAKDTWRGTRRLGGGVWSPPAIDPELGVIYVAVGNPTPNYDGSSRLGMNLFTNSLLALNLMTGKLLWHYQVIHHDIWDWDLVNGPTLFDATVGGKQAKVVAVAPKNCFVYFFDRKTGEPIHSFVETAVPVTTDVPGEQPWPTQPIPYTSRSVPQEPFCAIRPRVTDGALAKRIRPLYHPYQSGQFVITSPGNTGGPNIGRSSFSPRTGLFYISGKNDAYSITTKTIGENLPEVGHPGNKGHFGLIAEVGPTGMTSTQSVGAYDPATGNLSWVVELPGVTGTGNFATAGDVLVQAVGRDFYVLDARSGAQLYKTSMKAGTRSTPMTYRAGGRQFIAMVSGNSVVAWGLP